MYSIKLIIFMRLIKNEAVYGKIIVSRSTKNSRMKGS